MQVATAEKASCAVSNEETIKVNHETTKSMEPSSEEADATLLPGKMVWFAGNISKMLNVKVRIHDRDYDALIDTGAAKSLISESLSNQLDLPINNSNIELKSIGNNAIAVKGLSSTVISVHGILMKPNNFIIVKDFSVNPIVLGVDFLKNNNLEVSISERKLIKHCDNLGSFEIYLDDWGHSKSKVVRNILCCASETVEIPDMCTTSVKVEFSSDVPTDSCLLYSDEMMDRKLHERVQGLNGVCDSQLQQILLVSSETRTIIKKGQVLGALSTVVDADEEDTQKQVVDTVDMEKIRETVAVGLADDQRSRVHQLLQSYQDIFGSSTFKGTQASVTKHQIKLYDDTPIFQKPRRFPAPIAEEIERQCQELNALDIIEPSVSPWSSPIVPVQKKDGSLRLCIDYRKLNKVTIPDKFPIPNLTDSLFGLYGTKFFTSLDLVSGYHQIPLQEDSRELTAFSMPRNHWQFKSLSFGLCNAPATFQREIQAVLSAFPSNKVIAYIDDILIMTKTFEEHLLLVGKVLHTLREYNIKLKPSKCEWFCGEMRFLGHIISSSGVRKTPEYVQSITNYPRPEAVGELRKFLGFVNFQRKFLPNCSELQKPLSSLTGGCKRAKLNWTDAMQEAFGRLKEELQQDIELAYPDYSDSAEKIELWVDASAYGAGAYLAQVQGECHRIIGFASMSFSSAQLNYSTFERELAALRWGIRTFRPFLYGVHFILYTDHQPLVHLYNSRLVSSRLARTLDDLAVFNFEIRYTPGHLNTAADVLSRLGNVPPLLTELDDSLPQGLVVDGQPVAGGGDSLFVSVYRLLSKMPVTLPDSALELRQQLVEELSSHPDRYKISLDKKGRQDLKIMRLKGQLPSLDVLLSLSFLYKVRVFVYFWPDQPVVYQYQNFIPVIHLQCISGIHLNPLIEVKHYELPETVNNLVTCQSPAVLFNKNVLPCADDCDTLECLFAEEVGATELDQLKSLLLVTDEWYCSHEVPPQPLVRVTVSNSKYCAVLDTGAELSLVTKSVMSRLQTSTEMDVTIEEELLCDIIGLTGNRVRISQTAELSFCIGSSFIVNKFKFAVVPDSTFPHCFLFGLDFLSLFQISIDFSQAQCKANGSQIASLVTLRNVPESLAIMTQTTRASHTLGLKIDEFDNVRFEVVCLAQSVAGMALLIEDDNIRNLQSRY